MEVVPLNFGLKYRPPKLGIQYYISDKPSVTLVYEVPLSHVNKTSNTEWITKELFEKHKLYLNPKVVSQSQVKRLLDRLVRNTADKENTSNNNKPNKTSENTKKQPFQEQQKLVEMTPESEMSARSGKQNYQNNQSISRIDSAREEDHQYAEDLLISDIQQTHSAQKGDHDEEDLEKFLKTGAFTKEMMGNTMQNLGNTIKEVKQQMEKHDEGEEDYADDFSQSQQQHQESMQEFSQQQEIMMSGFAEGEEGAFGDESQQQMVEDDGEMQQQQNQEEDEDVIDIDNPDELAAKGLKRIQIEGEDEEYLMDMEGNIYDLKGNFIGTTDGDGDNPLGGGGESQLMGEEEQFDEEVEEY